MKTTKFDIPVITVKQIHITDGMKHLISAIIDGDASMSDIYKALCKDHNISVSEAKNLVQQIKD